MSAQPLNEGNASYVDHDTDESDHNIIEFTDDDNTNDSTVQKVEIQEILSP